MMIDEYRKDGFRLASIQEEALTDGSKVYKVALGNIVLLAEDATHATAMFAAITGGMDTALDAYITAAPHA